MVRIGVIGAMQEEVSALISQMKDKEEYTIAGMTFCKGNLWNQDAVVVRSGVGKVNIGICTQLMITVFSVDFVINTGVAGGLYKDINVGDIVISSDALQHDLDCSAHGFKKGAIPDMESSVFKADPELVDLAREACELVNPEISCYVGRVVTGDQFIGGSEKKKELVELFDAYCVEMEGGAMAQVAWLNKVPFVIVRAITDRADDTAAVDYNTFVQEAIVHTVKLLAAMFLKLGR